MNWGTLSHAERDAAYNNTMAVKNSADLSAAREAASAEFRRAHPGHLDLRYGPKDRNTWDLFPAANPNAPCIVFIHGGYWRSFDKSSFSHVAGPANAAGFDVAVPGYTLCPEVTLADIIDEIRQCCLFLGQRSGRRLVLTGHSAGGHLAAAMTATEWPLYGARSDLIQACLSVSGLFDLRPLMATSYNNDLRLSPAGAMAASPLFWPMTSRIPFDSWVGVEESFEFRRQARSLAAAWSGLGLSCRYEEVAGENHFSIGDLFARADHPMTQRLLELARS